MFASTKTKDITLDGDTAGTQVVVTIRKLSWKQLRQASENQTADAVKSAATAGPELLRALRDVAAPAAAAPAPNGKPDPEERYRRYQRDAVLIYGVQRWSLEVPVKAGLDDLDEPTAERLHREILDLSLPAAGEGAEEAARGEGSGTFTAS